MRNLTFIALFALLFTCFSVGILSAQPKTRTYIYDPLLAPREHVVDFQHLKLEVSFEPQINLVKGKVTHSFISLRQKLDSIVLDGVNMKIKEVLFDGKVAKYNTDSLHVIVYTPSLAWDQKGTITITYEATPRKGLYFIGWNDKTEICRRQIWSQGQGIDNRNWIPMYDEMNDKTTTEMIVTFDTAYKVLSNGKRIEKKINKNGTYTWHYKMSHPFSPYLIMVGIGKYDIKETKSLSGVPINLWYYPEWKDRVEATYKHSEKMVDFYEKEIGIPYPWESYSQIPVQDFMYGAMENATATVFGDFFFVDERSYLGRNYVSVNAHELAHQWFGDYVTARSDAHHWLQESFATYYNWLFEREVFGQDHFDWGRRGAQTNSLDESLKNNMPVAHSEAGSVRHYPKGAFVLNMLKYVLGGREVYNRCIKTYLLQHPYGNVDTRDLMVTCEEITGMDLNWFFEEWIFKGGEPSYKVTFRDVTIDAKGKKPGRYAEFIVKQTQELTEFTGLPSSGSKSKNSVNDDPFVQATNKDEYTPAGLWKMPIWFEVHYTDGTVDKKKIWIQKLSETIQFEIPENKIVDFALFDPDNQILKSVTFEKSFEALKSQASKASSILDRHDALHAMSTIDIERKRDFLITFYNAVPDNSFYLLKGEVIRQLSQDDDKKSIGTIRSALTDKDVKIRQSVLDNMKVLQQELLTDVEKLLKDPSYDVITNVLEYLSFANPEKIPFYLEQTKDVEGAPGRNVKMKWLEIASMSNEKYVDQLISFASNTYEFRTRVNAITSLKKLNYLDVNEIEYLVDAMLSANTRLAGPAAAALKNFYEQLRYKRQIINYIESKEWKTWENEIIKEVVK